MAIVKEWQSKRFRRLVKRVQAVETLAMLDLEAICIFYKVCDLLCINASNLPDNSGFYDNILKVK